MSASVSALLAMVLVPALSLAQDAAPSTLRILNWPDYFDPELLTAFEAEYGARIIQTYYESGDTRTQILYDNHGKGYDIVITDGIALEIYLDQGWLAEISESQVPNLRHIDPYWRSARPYSVSHAVPFFWGTLGIGYRADLVSEPFTSWLQLFDPVDELANRIVMTYDQRDLLGMALVALGYSVNSTDERALAQAEDLLLHQRASVRSYAYISLAEESAMVSGDVWAAMMYNGDALLLQQYHSGIAYAVPSEGTMLWIDYYTVLSSSENQDLAMAFIDFMNTPENAAQQARHSHFATPNTAAEALLPAEFLSDPAIYPDAEILARSELIEPIPAHVLRRYASVFANVTR